MLTLSISNGTSQKTLKVPTSLSEISLDYLKAVTQEVNIAPNYAIVAYIVVDKLGILCDLSKKPESGVIFELVRKNDPHNALSEVNEGEKLIAAGTDVMRGIEVKAANNVLQTSNIIRLVKSCGEDENGHKIINPYLSMSGEQSCYSKVVYTVGFKLVPLCDIHGSYGDIKNVDIKAWINNEVNKFYN